MVLITGGSFQGKLDYALHYSGLSSDDVIEGELCALDNLNAVKILNNFHLLVKRLLIENIDVNLFVDQLIQKNPDIIIIVNELGSGIIPIDSFDRKFRETTGRVCCKIVKQTKEVHRVVCGIGMVIKND